MHGSRTSPLVAADYLFYNSILSQRIASRRKITLTVGTAYMGSMSLDHNSFISLEDTARKSRPTTESHEIEQLLRAFDQDAATSGNNGGRSVKAKRKRANSHQIKMLNQVLKYNNFPSKELREKIAQKVGMHPRSVQIWFQNKRQEMKKKIQSSTELSQEINSRNSTPISMHDYKQQPPPEHSLHSTEPQGMIKLPPISNLRGSSDKNTRPYTPNDSATHPQGLLPRLIPRYKVPKLKLPLRSIAGSNTDQLKLRHDLLELQVPLKFRL